MMAALVWGGAVAPGESLDRNGFLWGPHLEWSFENEDETGNPFDIEATAMFTHTGSGETRRTGMFFNGAMKWKLRFTGTRTGEWTFVTQSAAAALHGKRGKVRILEGRPADPAGKGAHSRGFIMSVDGNRWGWSGQTGAVFVPQLVMGRDLPAYGTNPKKIDDDIKTWLIEHGFTGIHIAVLCRWFDFDQASSDKILKSDPNPDRRTFEVLENLIGRFHDAGGMVHIWAWGDESRRMTPVKWGINGKADKRLQRYIAARLGPLPGWTMSYGFDLWEWVEGRQLEEWHRYMYQHLGWPHLLGARWKKNELTQATEALDYASYEQHRPDYQRYVEMIEKRPRKPAFAEDRFRVREPSPYPEKDYDLEMTRRGLWHSTMAGGVANIWGYLVPSGDEGGSRPYPNREQIQTYARFFKNRLPRGIERANNLRDGFVLRWKDDRRALLIIYKEDTAQIQMDLSGIGVARRAVAVDTRKAYKELELGPLAMEKQTWRAPYRSDWAIAVHVGSGPDG